MGRQQTVLWAGISVIIGVICLGAAEPQYSKSGQAGSSIEASRDLDGAPTVMIPAGPFTMGSDADRWCRREAISRRVKGQAQPVMALCRKTTLLNCFCDRLYG